ncbi:hypothetical protein GX830_00995, partial [Candidatus Dojkabacteria bacterium]|nr:hypothetical protein [Candidatus Dojkabacteria bacterium]
IRELRISTYFNTIQEAIGKSAEGNTIYVEEGTCVENIVIDKNLTLTGEGKTILKPENSSQPIIKISTDNVTVEKFVLQESETYAILVTGASSVTLKDNSFLNNYMGVLIRQSTNVLIEDNSFNKGSLGLSIGHARDAKDSSTGNTVKGNIFSNLNPSGGATPIITLIKTSKNTIENNKIAKNRTQGGGISLSGSNNNIIKGNGITDNNVIPFGEGLVYGVGIKLFSSEGNSIIENTIINHNSGIDLSASGRNSIEENILDSNWHGIYLRGDDSTKNTITKNQITNNKTVGIDAPPKGTGIYFFQSTSNNDTEIKYNNFSGNEDKAIRYEGKKVLDATLNWWGHISGPSGTANGLGDAVSSNVLFEEWLCEPYENDETVSTSQNGVCKLEPPIQVGYYAKGSNTLIGCQDAYTNINGISIHWSDDNYFGQKNIKYERQYKVGNGSWKGSEIFTNLYTDYRAFGEKEGTDGIYGSQVRVFYDANDDGKYTLGEPASDWSNACSITYDKTPPKVKITSPIQDDLLKGVIEIKGHVSDNNLSHYNIAIYPAGVDVEDFSKRIEQNTKYTSEFDDKPLYSWNTTNGNFPDGEYQIRLAARDLAGNRDLNGDSKDVITVYVDNTSPSSTITSPSNEFITNQKMNIKGNTSDNHFVNKVTISYTNWSSKEEDCNYENWKELVVLENTEVKLPFNWARDAWSPEDGIYCIKAQGTDLAGNIENTSIIKNIIYDTEKPE